jgi:hypothetical protein
VSKWHVHRKSGKAQPNLNHTLCKTRYVSQKNKKRRAWQDIWRVSRQMCCKMAIMRINDVIHVRLSYFIFVLKDKCPDWRQTVVKMMRYVFGCLVLYLYWKTSVKTTDKRKIKWRDMCNVGSTYNGQDVHVTCICDMCRTCFSYGIMDDSTFKKKQDTRHCYQTYKMTSKHVLFCMTSQMAEWHCACQTYMTDVTRKRHISDKMAFLTKNGRWMTVWLLCMSALPWLEADGRCIQRWNKT